MVHARSALPKRRNRKGNPRVHRHRSARSTNMLTGAATATVNRIPVLLFASDIFAHRRPGNVLQQTEHPTEADASVNDCFRPVSRFFDRISRPEQLLTALPRPCGFLCRPRRHGGGRPYPSRKNVQGEAFDYPVEFFEERRGESGVVGRVKKTLIRQ